MLKGIAGILIFGLIFIAIIIMVVLFFVYKGYRSVREAQEDFIKSSGGKRYSRQEYLRYQKENKERNPFGDDYFKSAGSGGSSNDKGSATRKPGGSFGRKGGAQQQQQPKTEQQQTTTRKTTTSSGVTIIDDRDTEEKRKIFDHSDGEYVEFEEV